MDDKSSVRHDVLHVEPQSRSFPPSMCFCLLVPRVSCCYVRVFSLYRVFNLHGAFYFFRLFPMCMPPFLVFLHFIWVYASVFVPFDLYMPLFFIE